MMIRKESLFSVGTDAAPQTAWRNGVERAEGILAEKPDDIYANMSLVTALYYLGDYNRAIDVYTRIESRLPARTLWYHVEPILAYYEAGEHDRVLSLIDEILRSGNRAYAELYVVRGKIYHERGDEAAARAEFEKAVLYNKHLPEAKEALESLGKEKPID